MSGLLDMMHLGSVVSFTVGGQRCRCVIQLGDLQSEEERDVLLEMSLPAMGEEAKDWAVVYPKLTYFNVISSMMEEVAVDMKVQRCQEGKE